MIFALRGDRNDIHLKPPQLGEAVQVKMGCDLRTDHSESYFIHIFLTPSFFLQIFLSAFCILPSAVYFSAITS
jgi:hypothetical protein